MNKGMLCLALSGVLASNHVVGLGAQTQAPGSITGVVLPGSGVVSGSVASSSGRRLSGITMQLVNVRGVSTAKAVTTRNGEFSFAPVPYDTYTVQCMDNGKVLGTSSVTLTQGTQSIDMVCTSDAAFWKKWGLLTGLAGAATAIGAVGIVAAGDDASGSR